MSTRNSKSPKRRFDSSALKTAGQAFDRAGTGFFRWMITDHTRDFTALVEPPSSGFLAHLRYHLKCLLVSVSVAVIRSVLLVVLYLIWIPFLMWALIWFLQQ
jgi:hypothetical protein